MKYLIKGFRTLRSEIWFIVNRDLRFHKDDNSLVGKCVKGILNKKGGLRALNFLKEVEYITKKNYRTYSAKHNLISKLYRRYL